MGTERSKRSEGEVGRIRRSDIVELFEQNRQMRELLLTWPARQVLLDYEKEWNERRLAFLAQHTPVENEVESIQNELK